MRRLLPESGDKAAAPEPWCSRPAQPWPHSPLLRGLNPWAPPSRSARITVRPYPRAAARLRAPAALLRCPLCHRPSVPALLGAPGLGLPAPPRRAPGLSPALQPLSASSPLTSGGVGGVERRPGAGHEVRPRKGLRPPAIHRPPHPPTRAPRRLTRTPAPPRALQPRASESRSTPQRREVGRGRDSGHCLGGIGLTRSFRSVPQGWAAGLGNGAEELPTLQLLDQRGQATSGRVSEGGVPGN